MADETNRNVTEQPQDMGELLRIRRDKLKALQDEGRDPFTITKFDVTHHTQDIKDNFDALEGKPVSVAGRLMSKRGMGKVSFCDLQDKTGRIQLYARKDEMDADNYDRFKTSATSSASTARCSAPSGAKCPSVPTILPC